MASKHTKRCSTPCVIREMLIKTITMRYQYTPVRMAKIKKKNSNTVKQLVRMQDGTDTLEEVV